MKKITIKVEGMMCGMCEAHVCDAIRKADPSAKKVKASRMRNEAAFLSENDPDEEMIVKAIADMGYAVGKVSIEPYKRRFLFGR